MRALLFISLETEAAEMAEQAPRVNNPCESGRDGRGEATVGEIIRNFGAIGNGRAVLLRPVGWAQEGEGKRKAGG